jgi:hypothetical protein
MAYMKEFMLDVCEKYYQGMTCAQIAEEYPECITEKYITEIVQAWFVKLLVNGAIG